jgi:hypothetical protein
VELRSVTQGTNRTEGCGGVSLGALAEYQGVNNVSAANPERKVTVAARVPPELAQQVAALAEAGDRTLSREVFRALRAHVSKMSTVGGSFAEKSASGRSKPVDALAERDGTSCRREAVEPAQLAGER